jgi:F420-dependent oxidoreductase-like protein
MGIGVMIRQDPASLNDIDDVVEQARLARLLGVRHLWFGQGFGLDAVTLSAVVAVAVPGVDVGTAVVPINPRHPLVLSGAAQTTQAAAQGRFSLGLGLAGHAAERRAFGLLHTDSIGRLREYLTVLRSVFTDGAVDFDGQHLSAHVAATGPFGGSVAGGMPIPIYIAAMGPRALAVAGELGDGTIPFLAGPRTINEFIKPTIEKAAANADRPQPRIIAMVPVLVTHDIESGRVAARANLAGYDRVPSYRRVLDREELATAADVAVIGPPNTVVAGLKCYLAAGATDLILYPIRSEHVAVQQIWRLIGAM